MFFFFLAFAGYTVRTAREMNEVVFSRFCIFRGTEESDDMWKKTDQQTLMTTTKPSLPKKWF